MNQPENTAAPAAAGQVSIAEIAAFCRQLRALSDSTDPTTERAAFLARKADLFARLHAQRPESAPTGGGPAAGGPA